MSGTSVEKHIKDQLSADGILSELREYAAVYSLKLYDSIESTNAKMKQKVSKLPEWYTIIAQRQTAGHGRLDRPFFSPSDSGIYLSVLIRPACMAEKAVMITAAAAVAACRAIEECSDARPEIKWVNDIYINGKKVCGILAEGEFSEHEESFSEIVLGAGFNVYQPESGFPEELTDIAGSITREKQPGLRNRLTASFLRHLYSFSHELSSPELLREYIGRSMLIGRDVNVILAQKQYPATVLGIDEDCRLIIRREDGTEESLSFGEVSVKPTVSI